MQRRFSRMSPLGLQKFVEKWGLTKREAATRLGMSERAVYAHIAGQRKIPQQLAMLVSALDELWTIKRRQQRNSEN